MTLGADRFAPFRIQMAGVHNCVVRGVFGLACRDMLTARPVAAFAPNGFFKKPWFAKSVSLTANEIRQSGMAGKASGRHSPFESRMTFRGILRIQIPCTLFGIPI